MLFERTRPQSRMHRQKKLGLINLMYRQTADNFQASYTFLELLQIWPPVDPEITSKVKYAKYHAVRIAKAIKAGEDPNKSNPAPPEPTQNQAAPQLDPNDPEVRALQGQSPAPQQPPAGFHQPSIEDVPDEHDRIAPSLAQASTLNQSLHPSRDSSIPRPAPDYPPATVPAPSDPAENFYQTSAAPANGEVSPLGPPSTAAPPSVGGSYFPRIPDDPHAEPKSEEPLLPSAPSNIPQSPPDVAPISPPGTQPSAPPPNFASLPPSAAQPYPPQPPIQSPNVQSPIQPPHQAPSQNLPFGYQNYGTVPTSQPRPPPSAQHPPPQQQYTGHWHQPQPGPPPQSTPYQPQQPPQPQDTVVDEEAITKAQKHARWAISALNFEDVPTAIKELRGALETLGAR